MATKYGADGPSNFQSRANFTSVCATAGPAMTATATVAATPRILIACMFSRSPLRPIAPACCRPVQQSACQPYATTKRAAKHRLSSKTSAADLKFLHRLRQTHFRNFKSKSGTRIICLLVPLLLPKFVSEGAAMCHELRKRGTSADPVLKVEHLTMRFGGLVAVHDLSFAATRGDITALIGPNGAGKTTVFNCITGFYKPTEGRIALQSGDAQVWEDLEALTDRGTRTLHRGTGALFLLERMPDYLVTQKARVARTFQNIRLFQGMTVLENLLVAQHNSLMWASGFTVLGALGLRSYARAERSAIDKARYWLDRTALTDRADDPAGELPYGGQRRLEIARAMCTDPVLLCLDEPAAGLNPNESAELGRYLHSIRDEHATSILLIEHDMTGGV